MSVTITKRFWNTTDIQWDDIAKIVFTSPNMDSPAAAGTRSHILPGSDYIGTWYEAVDQMHRIKDDQAYPTSARESYFAELFLYQPTFDFSTDTTMSGVCKYDPQTLTGGILHYDRTNYATINTVTPTGTVDILGTTYNKYYFTLVSGTGTATISGSTTTTSGIDTIYNWDDTVTNTSWSHASNSVVFEVTNGEAYNCRLTAWDDDSHSTTVNQILSDNHYRVVVAAYKAGSWQVDEGTQKEKPKSANIVDSMIHPPGINIPLKGNTLYYGDFDLVHVPVENTPHGEYLIFTPYLYNITAAFSSGNYDFVTTLHFQYT